MGVLAVLDSPLDAYYRRMNTQVLGDPYNHRVFGRRCIFRRYVSGRAIGGANRGKANRGYTVSDKIVKKLRLLEMGVQFHFIDGRFYMSIP